MNRKYITIGGLAIITLGVFYFWPKQSALEAEFAKLNANPVQVRDFKGVNPEDIVLPNESDAEEAPFSFAEKVAYLQQMYGDQIRNRRVQIKVLEKLWRLYLKDKDPGVLAEIQELLQAAFPEWADDMWKLLQTHLDYQDWLADNRIDLTALSYKERQAELWKQRRDMYGEDAANEIWAAQLNTEKVYDSLQSLNEQSLSASEKAEDFVENLEEIYGDDAQEILTQRRNELTTGFLNLDSVQDELEGLDRDNRLQALEDIRRNLGYDDEALDRFRSLDETREDRWDKGAQYMDQRAKLSATLTGPSLEQSLQALRQQYFPEQADSIAAEEAAGVFRFNRDRIYGRN